MVKAYNPTLETYRTQVNSVGATFPARGETELPLDSAELFAQKIAHRGIFIIWPGQKIEDLKNVNIQGLKNFYEFNKERISLEEKYLDERRKAGVTIDMSGQHKLNQWKQWDKELGELLNANNVIEKPKSFLDVGLEFDNVVSEVMPVSAAQVEEIEVKKESRGRKAKMPEKVAYEEVLDDDEA